MTRHPTFVSTDGSLASPPAPCPWPVCCRSRLPARLADFKASVAKEPLIPLGAPLDYVPGQSGTKTPFGFSRSVASPSGKH